MIELLASNLVYLPDSTLNMTEIILEILEFYLLVSL
jgi:hypothetical protein